jgi:hypothetical protein
MASLPDSNQNAGKDARARTSTARRGWGRFPSLYLIGMENTFIGL